MAKKSTDDKTYSKADVRSAIAAASRTLSARKGEVDRLNVFPVPDGDTGTNMSLTLESVVHNLEGLPADASGEAIRKAITTGALMGARGNSGVITSQILRGLCEGSADAEAFTTAAVADAFESAVEVAFQAVRKPVEGTILTVLRDTAQAAQKAKKKKMALDEALEFIVASAYESVESTPEFLPVLKENGVVDAGGFGLAILMDAFVAALQGKTDALGGEVVFERVTAGAAPKVEIERNEDWENSRFRYCNEFLVDSDTLNAAEALEFLATMGDCELCVGENPKFKVHVHSDHPDQVLAYFLKQGQISEVYIHNMQLQAAERTELLEREQQAMANQVAADRAAGETAVAQAAAEKPRRPLGFVAVAPGEGNKAILESLGVDVVVSGGQTMNPSTKDLLDAVTQVNADSVIILPDNSNIIMAANAARELADVPCGVVPTRSVPEAFAALIAVDQDATLEENIEAMEEAIAEVHTGEVTTAVKKSKDAHGNPIKKGDVIGIADGSIEVVTNDVAEAVMGLLAVMDADEADTCTILAGEDMTDEALADLVDRIEDAYDELEVDAHRGGQPLYPVVLSVE